MTEIELFTHKYKVCFGRAGSLRDMSANKAWLLPDFIEMSPAKSRTICVDVGRNEIVVKYYVSNRGKEYVKIFRLVEEEGKGVYLDKVYSADYIDYCEIEYVLRQEGLERFLGQIERALG